MDTYSAFQLANPLSPKKFTKKMLPQVLAWTFLFGFMLVLFLVYWLASAQQGRSSPLLVAAIALPLVLFFITVLLNAVYYRAFIRRYYYDAGDHFITIKKGVFAPTEIHVQYAKIQDVYVDQDIFDRMLGIFDVHIASATTTSGIEAHIDGVDKETAERIKEFFLSKIVGGASVSQDVSTPAVAVSTSAVSVPEIQPVAASGAEISSSTYPPSRRYFVGAVLGSFVRVLIFWIIFLNKTFNSFLPPADLGWALLGIFTINMLYNIVWFNNYYFLFDKGMIVFKTRVISTSETHVPYHTIQDVVLSQGIFDRMLGIASVTVQNAAQNNVGIKGSSGSNGAVLIAQPIAKANELVEVVRGIIRQSNPSGTGL